MSASFHLNRLKRERLPELVFLSRGGQARASERSRPSCKHWNSKAAQSFAARRFNGSMLELQNGF